MRQTLALAILWSIILITNIINAAIGADPTWVLVFCPLVCYVSALWVQYIDERLDD